MPIVARVRDFDFSQVHHFLSTLEKVHQDTFKVQHDGTSARKFFIELQGPYTTSSMENLQRWTQYVDLFVGPENGAELSALYKAVETVGPNREAITAIVLPSSQFHAAIHRCFPIAALQEVQEYLQILRLVVGGWNWKRSWRLLPPG